MHLYFDKTTPVYKKEIIYNDKETGDNYRTTKKIFIAKSF